RIRARSTASGEVARQHCHGDEQSDGDGKRERIASAGLKKDGGDQSSEREGTEQTEGCTGEDQAESSPCGEAENVAGSHSKSDAHGHFVLALRNRKSHQAINSDGRKKQSEGTK